MTTKRKPRPAGDAPVPPQNIEAERSVLGAMLLNPDEAVPVGIEILGHEPAGLFYVDAHQHLYAAVLDLFKDRVPVDSVTLMERMNRLGTLDAAGGVSYIAGLTSAVPTSANAKYYADIVKDAATLRHLISTCSRIAAEAYAPQESAADIVQQAHKAITDIGGAVEKSKVVTVADGLDATVDRVMALYETRSNGGLLTGYAKLDEMLNGIERGSVTVLAARTSVGKTALALNLANNVALQGKNVLVMSLEMQSNQLNDRLLYMIGGIEKRRVIGHYYSRKQLAGLLSEAAKKTQYANIYVYDDARVTVFDIANRIRSFRRERPLDLVIVDYLQLITSTNRKAQRQEQVAEISRELKITAGMEDVPLLVLSQLNREAENGDPQLSHLRESGAIEQDAENVLLMARGDGNVIRINIAKNRQGPTGIIGLVFDKDIQAFRDWDGTDEDGRRPHDRPILPRAPAPPMEDIYEDSEVPF